MKFDLGTVITLSIVSVILIGTGSIISDRELDKRISVLEQSK